MLNQGKEISARDFDIYHPSSLIYWTNNINNTIQFARLTSDGIGIMLGSIGLRDDQGQLKMDIVPDQIKIGSKTGQIIFTNSCGGRHPCELIYKVHTGFKLAAVFFKDIWNSLAIFGSACSIKIFLENEIPSKTVATKFRIYFVFIFDFQVIFSQKWTAQIWTRF